MIEKYLELGWYLFPIRERSKVPLTATGFKDASNSPQKIEEWQFSYPASLNWGISTGPSNLLVVDLDVHKGGTRAALEAAIGPLPNTVEVMTGSGGTHLFYRRPGPLKNKLGFIKGVDLIASTGYVVAPPSVHPNGETYSWVRDPFSYPLTAAPENLLRVFEAPAASKQSPLQNPETEDLYITSGMGRFDYLRKYAGALRRHGWGVKAIEGALLAFYKEQCEPDAEMPAKIRSMSEYVGRQPYESGKRIQVRTPSGKIIWVTEVLAEQAMRQGGVLVSVVGNNKGEDK